MKEKKNTKFIIIIVILIILLIGCVGYIVYDTFIKEDEVVENNDNQNNNSDNQDNEENNNNEEDELSEEEEIAIIEDELGKIFTCTNGDDFCVEYMWYSVMIPDITNQDLNYDFFELAAPYIMEGVYNQEYINVNWQLGTVYLMTEGQEEEFSNYFDIDLTFDEYDGLYGFGSYDNLLESCSDDTNCEYIDNYNKYGNKGYKIAYAVGDGFGSHGTHFEIEDITKNNDKYKVDVLVTPDELWLNEETKNIAIHTSVDVEIVDGHCKFGSMIVRK